MDDVLTTKHRKLLKETQQLASQRRFNDAYHFIEHESGLSHEEACEVRALCEPQVPTPRPYDPIEDAAFKRVRRARAVQRIRKRAEEWGVTNDTPPLEMRRFVNSFTVEKDYEAASYDAMVDAGLILKEAPQ